MFNDANIDHIISRDWDNYHMFGTLYPTQNDYATMLAEFYDTEYQEWLDEADEWNAKYNDDWYKYEDEVSF